jgi:hypothetical protein
MAVPKRSKMCIASATSVPEGTPVFRAFGDEDDHLRLTALIADAFSDADPAASSVCRTPNTPWSARREALDELLLAVARGAPRLAAIVDPDALAPPLGSVALDEPGFAHERRELFDALLHAVRRGGWLLVRPWPRPDLAESFSDLKVDADWDADEAEDGLLSVVAPAARPLADWLRGRGALGQHRLQRLLDDGADVSEVVLQEACSALPASTATAAERLALLRPPQAANGHVGPFALADRPGAYELDQNAVARLREAGFVQSAGDSGEWVVPAAIRRALRDAARGGQSPHDVASDHAWLSRTIGSEGASPGSQIEAHHHAVQAGDLERAISTARFYGTDIRVLAFRLGREAAAKHDRALFKRAADAYRVVIDRFDASDAYSWEYYAYNFARAHGGHLPEEAARSVETGYCRAHELAPANPLFHGRWVGFRAELGTFDRAEVDRALARYRSSQGARSAALFGQTVIDGLRRAGRHDDAAAIARQWHIVPPERVFYPAATRPSRRFGVAAGTITVPDDFDEPLEDFAPYE